MTDEARPPGFAIEQDRRNLMTSDRALYNYIRDIETAKALKRAGDHISHHHAAANQVWALSYPPAERARRARGEGAED